MYVEASGGTRRFELYFVISKIPRDDQGCTSVLNLLSNELFTSKVEAGSVQYEIGPCCENVIPVPDASLARW
jgi:hypothetical protein